MGSRAPHVTALHSSLTRTKPFVANIKPARMQRIVIASAAVNVQDKVQEWLSMDRDAASRAAVENLVQKQAVTQLEELMCKRLEFGGVHWTTRLDHFQAAAAAAASHLAAIAASIAQ